MEDVYNQRVLRVSSHSNATEQDRAGALTTNDGGGRELISDNSGVLSCIRYIVVHVINHTSTLIVKLDSAVGGDFFDWVSDLTASGDQQVTTIIYKLEEVCSSDSVTEGSDRGSKDYNVVVEPLTVLFDNQGAVGGILENNLR